LPQYPEFLTTSATARALNRSEHTVRKYDQTGILPAVRASNGVRLFRRQAVEALKRTLDAQDAPEAGEV
jgi:DNA-binding transcriptional MerR regulator